MSYSGKFKDKNNNLHPVTSVLYGTCDTAAGTAAKVVTCADFDTLMTGVTIRVKFDNANTAASPTVNINSTGAKSVYRFGSTAPVDGDSWKAGEVVDLLYDGTSFFMVSADDIGSKQDALTFDDTPTDGSNNPVKSNGIYDALATKADTDMVAADFNAGTSYTAGNYCIYEGRFYKFKNSHSGAWSAADVDEIKIAGELSSLKSGLMNETVLLNQLLTTTSTSYNLNGLVGDYMFVAFILGWYGNDSNDNMIVMPSSAFNCNDYLILYRKNDPATNAYAKINQRGYANGVSNIYAEGTEGVSIKVVGIIHK